MDEFDGSLEAAIEKMEKALIGTIEAKFKAMRTIQNLVRQRYQILKEYEEKQL
jgi:hypothetical protein